MSTPMLLVLLSRYLWAGYGQRKEIEADFDKYLGNEVVSIIDFKTISEAFNLQLSHYINSVRHKKEGCIILANNDTAIYWTEINHGWQKVAFGEHIQEISIKL